MQCAAVSIPVALSTHDIWKLGTETTAADSSGEQLRVQANENLA